MFFNLTPRTPRLSFIISDVSDVRKQQQMFQMCFRKSKVAIDVVLTQRLKRHPRRLHWSLLKRQPRRLHNGSHGTEIAKLH